MCETQRIIPSQRTKGPPKPVVFLVSYRFLSRFPLSKCIISISLLSYPSNHLVSHGATHRRFFSLSIFLIDYRYGLWATHEYVTLNRGLLGPPRLHERKEFIHGSLFFSLSDSHKLVAWIQFLSQRFLFLVYRMKQSESYFFVHNSFLFL